MARYLDVHPVDPQPRLLAQAVDLLRNDGVVACPTDSGYALCCAMGRKDPLERIARIRQLGASHHYTLLVSQFSQVGAWVDMDTSVFRALKAATPGPYTFILKATREVPRVMLHPRKKSIGIRVPQHRTILALLDAMTEPLVSSTLILPGEEHPMADGWQVKEALDHEVDAVLDSGECGLEPTTVIDWTDDEPEVVRLGAGDPSPFE